MANPTDQHACIGCTATENPHGTPDGGAMAAVAACKMFGADSVIKHLCERHACIIRNYSRALTSKLPS